MEAHESRLAPGHRLDRYELLCPIASGGMASVWLARLRGKRGFEKLFAIKTIKTELISDPHFQEMFLDEARIASRIVHPNVAQILELGEQDDVLYIVMEWVDGDSLAKINRLSLQRGVPLPSGVALRIIADTCAGLHAAHQLADDDGQSLGVVHRDVSPQNILVTTQGVAKVIDFGLVKARNRAAGTTASGVVKGKIRYMAPEQVSSKESVDRRADVWAVGMCLYELLTGHVPFHEQDELEVVKRLMSDRPEPPLDLAVPPQLEQILTRALAPEPKARFESCAAMRRALESAIGELDLPGGDEDVAEHVARTLPDLAEKRRTTIARAIEAADERHPSSSVESLAAPDIAFAKTEVSARDGSDGGPATKRSPSDAPPALDSDPEGVGSSYGASRTTSATRLVDQLGERRRRGRTVHVLGATTAALAAGAWLLWPRAEVPPPTPPVPAAKTAAPRPTTPEAPPGASSAPETPPSKPRAASAEAVLPPMTTEADAGTILDATAPLDAAPSTDAGGADAAAPLEASSAPDDAGPALFVPARSAAPPEETPAPTEAASPISSTLTNPPDAGTPPPLPPVDDHLPD